jgi:hypothetical protein
MGALAQRSDPQAIRLRTDFRQPLLGHVVGVLEHVQLKVHVPVLDSEFVTASCVEQVAERRGGLSGLIGEDVLLVCVAGDPKHVVVCGVIAREATIPTDDHLEVTVSRPQTAVLDGKKVVLDASQEIVLECGKGSLRLTADGRIVMKGVEIVSRALRTNKIKGGTVNIN